jgi:cob(I)alamin adenosyltransferase
LIGLGNLGEEDRRVAKGTLRFTEKIVKKRRRLMTLDEINLALHCDLLEVEEVAESLKKILKNIGVVLSGRYAPRELPEKLDFVNEMVDIKYPPETAATKEYNTTSMGTIT